MTDIPIGALSGMTSVPRETIRRYERQGFIAPARRRENGYRAFSPAHVPQLKLARLAFSGFYTRPLRAQTIKILRASAAGRAADCRREIDLYAHMIAEEQSRALLAAEALDLLPRAQIDRTPRYTRAEAARLVGASVEAIRGWERSGLVGAADFYARVRYAQSDIPRMRLVRLLLTCGYSMQAALEAMTSGGEALLAPGVWEELATVKDRWLQSLGEAAERAEQMRAVLKMADAPPF